ncbi:pyruvate, water dikinase regulatory protein [Aliidiomarina quisquiliarum]|uniref:posphoenolpyruvate synthetase regulatory kinase/phosphorylase PpsR n=1 Tax=Aliidiomarina quisquiliarum TaxID=2938947 RepID=UPI00208F33F5|nr:pyruvate, water dikinase regulatory protein [Aliidiomarina quisquiliarum]MCO4320635.1 kinase/pyrophosphorylase [Aliidiomarina quisquiliarum]
MRTAFYISDGTALTSETFGHAMLSMFPVEVKHRTLSFIDDEDKARQAVEEINTAYAESGEKPLVFHTIIDSTIKSIMTGSEGVSYDFLAHFVAPVQAALGVAPQPLANRTHGIHQDYTFRIDAVDYTLANDDGVTTKNYHEADIILVGASRTGKTPTCLYLALQYGVKAANYPLTEEDMHDLALPDELKLHRHKLFGLTINADRLQNIRDNRMANSRYASFEQCRKEVEHIESMYRREAIPYLNSTHASVEEIAAKIMSITKLKRYRY